MICALCPRACRVDRDAARGFCGMGGEVVVARAAPHYWEEPCIAGYGGAGTVFFSGCSLRCVYCQNQVISGGRVGRPVTVDRLRQIYRELIDEGGVHNIELVTGTHFIPQIAESLDPRPDVPVVWNSGGYELPSSLRLLAGKVQVYLPDLKYMDPALAGRYSAAPDYPERAVAAIHEMLRQVGAPVFDDEGLLVSGVLIRHLILPGQLDNTLDVIDAVSAFPKGSVLFSLMSQYTPPADVSLPDALNRRVTREEYERAVDYMYLCGIEDGYVQDLSSAQAQYTPDFDLTGVDGKEGQTS